MPAFCHKSLKSLAWDGRPETAKKLAEGARLVQLRPPLNQLAVAEGIG
jgi:hypothetical protein